MKKSILIICFILLVFLSFSYDGYFKRDVETITKIASRCIVEGAFYEDLFEVQTGLTLAEAVFIPNRILGQVDFIGNYSSGLGFIYFKFNQGAIEKGPIRFDIEEIAVSGREKDGDALTGARTNFYYIDENSIILMDSYYGNLLTSKEHFILFISRDLDTSYDFIVNLITDKVQGNWKVRKNSRDYEKIEEIVAEID